MNTARQTAETTSDNAKSNKPNWLQLLEHALKEPGTLSCAYRLFHSYSAGNCALLAEQSMFRGETLAPVASYAGWKALGYQVKRGSKAWAMLMPVTVHSRAQEEEDTAEKSERDDNKKTIFILRNNWFTLNQVEPGPDAQPLQEPETPEWKLDRACQTLNIARVEFDSANGNVQGFASSKGIALNPLAKFPVKTAAHELAHMLLGHIGDNGVVEHESLSGALREAEAESVAYIVAAMLGLEESALSSSRAYIQSWLSRSDANAQEFAKRSASRVFKVANKILKAGTQVATEQTGHE